MKVIVEFNFTTVSDLECAITRCKDLIQDHIKASQCKEKGKCDLVRDLWWMQMTFENVFEQFEKLEDSTYKYISKEEKK